MGRVGLILLKCLQVFNLATSMYFENALCAGGQVNDNQNTLPKILVLIINHMVCEGKNFKLKGTKRVSYYN